MRSCDYRVVENTYHEGLATETVKSDVLMLKNCHESDSFKHRVVLFTGSVAFPVSHAPFLPSLVRFEPFQPSVADKGNWRKGALDDVTPPRHRSHLHTVRMVTFLLGTRHM